MAASNRYSQITPSQFNPLSLEEVMMVPLMKRQQHDTFNKQLSDAQLKVDPLKVHEDEALQLQRDFEAKKLKYAEQLMREGVNPNSSSEFLKFNREYQDLISPMGRVGQINQAKKIYHENMKEYLEDATKNKKWSRERALDNWYKNHHSKYTGYDDPENKTNIVNIDQYGAPEKIELMQKLKDLKSILGEQVVNEFAAGNYSFARQDDGSLAIVNRNGRRIETSNAPNIQDALYMLYSELYDKNSAWNKSLLFEGRTPEQMLKLSEDGKSYEGELMSGLKSMLTTKVTDNRSKSLSFQGVKNLMDMEEVNSNIPSVTEPVVEFNNNRKNLSSSLSKIGSVKTTGVPKAHFMGEGAASRMSNTSKNQEYFTEKDLSKSEIEEYDVMYNAMVNSGLIDKNKPKFSKENITQIQNYIESNNNFSYSNKIIKPTAVDNDLQKPLVFTPKKGYDMTTHLTQEVSSGRRTMIDKDTQEKIDLTDYPNAKIEYVGMVSPANVLTKNDKTTFNKDSFVIPHVVQIVYKDGNVEKRKEVYMDRDAEEMKKPEFKASKVIKNVTLDSKRSPMLINKYSGNELNEIGLKEIETQYIPEQNGYIVKYKAKDPKYGEYMKTDSTGEPVIISEEELQNQMYELFNNPRKK